ncbi:MAG: ATP-binding protein, partial [Lachnospiraceae bacterium]|nr:ATP-binding protein [Lachnospiraceae bacterium]
MSFSQERREHIKRYILEKISEGQDGIAKKTSENFQISLNTVYRYFRELEEDGVISKDPKNNKRYTLVKCQNVVHLKRSQGELLEEDSIYMEYIDKYIKKLSNNIVRIWQYSFMEMMNNAIDHSLAEDVFLFISQNYMDTTIMIVDNGVGIFRKIKDYYHYATLDEAIQELFKGKLT